MLEKIKKIMIFAILFVIFLYNDLVYLLPFKLLSIDYKKLSTNLQVLCSLVASLFVIIIIIIVYRKYLKEKIIDFKNNFSKRVDPAFKYYMIGITVMVASNLLISMFSPIHQANNEELVQTMLRKAPILTFITATFTAPFLEEMLFRKSLGDIFSNKKVMIFASAIVFGLLHVIFSIETPWDLLYIIPYGALGYAFAASYQKTNNIFTSIFYHTIHNGILTLVSIALSILIKVLS